MISRDVACRVSDIVGTSFLFGTRNESIMFRVDAPFGGSGKRKAVSTGDKTMTGGVAAPSGGSKNCWAIFTGIRQCLKLAKQSARPALTEVHAQLLQVEMQEYETGNY